MWLSVAGLVWVSPALCEPATGNWTGAIDGHIVSLAHIEAGADGKLTGTFAIHETPLDAPDIHATTTPIDDVQPATGSTTTTCTTGSGGTCTAQAAAVTTTLNGDQVVALFAAQIASTWAFTTCPNRSTSCG